MHEVDFFDSDSEYHLFCDECYTEIPQWLIRWESTHTIDGDCDGCHRRRQGRLNEA